MKRQLILIQTILLLSGLSYAQQLKLKWATDTIFRIPESVLYDSKQNLLYVANIDGKSSERDGKGFISKLSTDGKLITLEFATGLNAPKGMGLYKDQLFVADLFRVVAIDINTGKFISTVEVEGAQFLNDITIDKKGNVYVSDSATGKIHLIKNNKAELYFSSPDFKRINGLLALKDELYVADAGTGVNYKLSKDKKLTKYTETAQGADGIVIAEKDDYIVSSWGGEVYYVDTQAKAVKILDTREQKLNSADVDYDIKTKTLFIPTFNGNSVMAYEFTK